jgi:hypothetical protein
MTYAIADPRIDANDRWCIDVRPVDAHCIYETEEMLVIDSAASLNPPVAC